MHSSQPLGTLRAFLRKGALIPLNTRTLLVCVFALVALADRVSAWLREALA